MKVVLNAEPYGYSEKAKELWVINGYDYQTSSWSEILDATIFNEVEILIVRLAKFVGKDTLQKFSALKYLVSATTGLDHIDQQYLLEKNIRLISLRGEDEFLKSIPSTAELSWALLINLLRPISAAVADVKSGNWNREHFRGYQLKGKKLGIIGMGRTGQLMGKYAHAFGMEVSYYDPFVSEIPLAERKETLESLVEEAEIISLHIHLLPETKNLFNSKLVSLAKQGAYLINTSRGKVWDEQAVSDAVKQGKIKGVASDVLATELNNHKESPLLKLMQEGFPVLITPHIGGATWEAMHSCEEFVTKKLLNYLCEN